MVKLTKNIFKPAARPKATTIGQAGYDNARENIDPHIKTKVVSTKEGSITKVPVNNNDIVNKKYVDDADVLKLDKDGGNADTTIDIGSEDLTTTGDIITGKLIVDTNILTANSVSDRVGVGTSTPGNRFEIKSTGNSTSPFVIEKHDVGTELIKFELDANSNSLLRLRNSGGSSKVVLNTSGNSFLTGGNLGVGRNDPAFSFDLMGIFRSTLTGGEISITSPQGSPGIIAKKDDSGVLQRRDIRFTAGGIALLTASGDTIPSTINGMNILENGNIGINTATPTIMFSTNEKSGMTETGGVAIKLTNKTGANSVSGQLVKADTANNDAVILTTAGDIECFGVFLDSGIADGSEAWVVVSGIADVAYDDNIGSVRGNWVGTGVAAGYAATSTSPPAAPTHFEEIGHCIETVAANGAGTHILARCVLHFN